MLARKKIAVGVTGGIAAYKSAELVRLLIKSGCQVRVLMTPAAARFVTPLTFESLTGHPVLIDLFPAEGGKTEHITWARWADLFVISPATANTMAKIAHGLADNALTTTLLATTAPLIFCPAMNKEMYANPAYQSNEKLLQARGFTIVSPERGELACGESGWGRLAANDEIMDAIKTVIAPVKDLRGKRLLITAGPTWEPLDPVRFLSNRSTGKMGFALAERAVLRGAQVTLIAGPTQLRPFSSVSLIQVTTAAEMAAMVEQQLAGCDVLLMAAAVSDYRPEEQAAQKIKKSTETMELPLVKTRDILQWAGRDKGQRIHVGFSVETSDEVAASQRKLDAKNLDMIVINNPLTPGAGFAVETNVVTLLRRGRDPEAWPQMSKLEVADRLLSAVLEWEKTRHV